MPSPLAPARSSILQVAGHRMPRPGIMEPVGPEVDAPRCHVGFRFRLIAAVTWLCLEPVRIAGSPEPIELLGVWTAEGHLLHIVDLATPLAPFGELTIAEVRLPPPGGLDHGWPGLDERLLELEAAEDARLERRARGTL